MPATQSIVQYDSTARNTGLCGQLPTRLDPVITMMLLVLGKEHNKKQGDAKTLAQCSHFKEQPAETRSRGGKVKWKSEPTNITRHEPAIMIGRNLIKNQRTTVQTLGDTNE